jgi:hypothetical protein
MRRLLNRKGWEERKANAGINREPDGRVLGQLVWWEERELRRNLFFKFFCRARCSGTCL